MANKLTPPPPTGTVLDRWLALLYQNLTAASQILWTSISKTGSSLADLETRNASAVNLERIGASTYSTVQDLQNIFHSAGWVTGGVVSDNGNGTVAVTAGNGVIRATNSSLAAIKFFDFAANASVSLTNLATNWVYIDYNAGAPAITVSTTEPTEHQTKIKLAAIYRNGTELHINQTVRYEIGDHAANMVRQMQETMPYAHVSGAMMAESGTRNLNLTAGVFWNGLSRFTTAALNTAVSGTFSTFHRNGAGGWTETTGQTQINNTNYDDGDGTLGTLSANRYTNRWVYLATDSDVHILYGQNQHVLLSDAQTESVPASIPAELLNDSFLIGRIIVRQGVTTLVQIDSAFMQTFNLASITDISEIAGLGTGVSTFLATPSSANLASAVTDETGSGALVFGTSPTVSNPTVSGDLTLSTLGGRIVGDFSNATLTNRVYLQSNTTNGATQVSFLPNGTSVNAGFAVVNSSDILNSSFINATTTATDLRIVSNKLGTASYLPMHILNGGSIRFTWETGGHIVPGADNTQNFGSGALRWKEIFAGNATINTSDAREKTPVRALSANELTVAKQLSSEIGIYQWLTAISEKGDNARFHVGMTVQRAIEVFAANGLDPFRYGLICYDEWGDKFVEHKAGEELPDGTILETDWTEQTMIAGNRYGFRGTELMLLIAAGINARLTDLENRI